LEALYYRPGNLVEFGRARQDIEVAWLGSGKKKVTGSKLLSPHGRGLLARLLAECPAFTASCERRCCNNGDAWIDSLNPKV